VGAVSRATLDRLARTLLEQEVIERDALETLLAADAPPGDAAQAPAIPPPPAS